MLWLGVVLLVGWYFEIGPLAEVHWIWVFAPFAVAFVWFEALEPVLGFDKRKLLKESEQDKERKERIRQQFATPGGK